MLQSLGIPLVPLILRLWLWLKYFDWTSPLGISWKENLSADIAYPHSSAVLSRALTCRRAQPVSKCTWNCFGSIIPLPPTNHLYVFRSSPGVPSSSTYTCFHHRQYTYIHLSAIGLVLGFMKCIMCNTVMLYVVVLCYMLCRCSSDTSTVGWEELHFNLKTPIQRIVTFINKWG